MKITCLDKKKRRNNLYILIDKNNLMYADDDTNDLSKITYYITKNPAYGQIKKVFKKILNTHYNVIHFL